MEAVLKKAASFRIIIALTTTALLLLERAEGSWCVARSDASDEALQTALDYACGAGADCAPLQSSGLCFLPNTIQAHASYAFNSFYQRNNIAPGSCDFAGTATLAITDPSYGSCVYPPNPSTAGAGSTPGTTTPYGPTPPSTTTPPATDGGAGLIPTANLGPPMPTSDDSSKSIPIPISMFSLQIPLLFLPLVL
ncbi:hypothetical protein Nepgr_022130 [Nepenthes gracilis]|uniref:X8 domain-containing protein n=1 Tax=Nepenthes gracilis TaxID=150966 RepID=A0AAD3T067_NEPGR|nr:hypothetical protein Nepgr_022130 [Nepenthes gracilis]